MKKFINIQENKQFEKVSFNSITIPVICEHIVNKGKTYCETNKNLLKANKNFV